jgi:hypothetical protein
MTAMLHRMRQELEEIEAIKTKLAATDTRLLLTIPSPKLESAFYSTVIVCQISNVQLDQAYVRYRVSQLYVGQKRSRPRALKKRGNPLGNGN